LLDNPDTSITGREAAETLAASSALGIGAPYQFMLSVYGAGGCPPA
jgi:hypothetical protein